MKNYLFDDWHQWKVVFLSGCREFGWGFKRIVTSIFFGTLSVIRLLWRLLVRFVGKNPTAAIVIFFTLCFLVWMFTYATGKAKLVSIEHSRDSLSYELLKHTHEKDSGAILSFDGDSVKTWDSYDRP